MTKLLQTLTNIVALSELKPLLNLKTKSLPEIVEYTGYLPNICRQIKDSKQGWLSIKKISDNYGYLNNGEEKSGWCGAFGEGLSARIVNTDDYYYTSNIEQIDWEKKEFNTHNSTYSFKFTDYSIEELLYFINNARIDSKSEETE